MCSSCSFDCDNIGFADKLEEITIFSMLNYIFIKCYISPLLKYFSMLFIRVFNIFFTTSFILRIKFKENVFYIFLSCHKIDRVKLTLEQYRFKISSIHALFSITIQFALCIPQCGVHGFNQLQMWRDKCVHCAAPFCVKDLSMCVFLASKGILEPVPTIGRWVCSQVSGKS